MHILIHVILICLFQLNKKKNSKLLFIDTAVSRQKGKFGMICTLAYGCFKLCSDWTKFHEELNFLKRVFLSNEYPLSFIDKCFKTV